MRKVLLILCVLVLFSACAKQKVVSQPPQADIKPVQQEQVVPKEQKAPEMKLQEAQIQQKEEPKKAKVEEVTPTMIAQAQTPTLETAKEDGVLSKMIHFDFDKYDIKKEYVSVLKEIAEYLKANPDIRILIEGHCDERGTREYNLQLGMRRAESAKKYLVDLGIDEKRIETISYGEDRPLINEQNESAWAKNRRCEFKRIK
ncbi:MAG: peptidoglycan-associated lipoprotein Pal [Proteobacteria bacterium]|nr:peptidoglycan-associated lipoprotein Pal [Pseudomonadota bacterium]